MKYIVLMVASLFLFVSSAESSTGIASWYGPGFHGRKTASGERFNQNAMTAAHKTLPFGTIVAVTHNGKTIRVRINDRGPFVKGRIIDLSKAAARALGCKGTCKVSLTVVSKKGRPATAGAKKKPVARKVVPAKKRTRNLLDFK